MTDLTSQDRRDGAMNPVLIALVWLWVLVPFGYGLY
jgi:hypothetical protein